MTNIQKRIKRKNNVLQHLVETLLSHSEEKEAPVWETVATYLSRPTRLRPEKNIRELDKEGNEDEILLVPGKVLGVGRTKKSLTVVAYKFSKTAKKHLEKNGKTMTIQEALEKHSEGKNMRILA